MYVAVNNELQLPGAIFGAVFDAMFDAIYDAVFGAMFGECLVQYSVQCMVQGLLHNCPEEVSLWSNHRVMDWLRSIDLSEYAPNLRGSGVHGGLMVCTNLDPDLLH